MIGKIVKQINQLHDIKGLFGFKSTVIFINKAQETGWAWGGGRLNNLSQFIPITFLSYLLESSKAYEKVSSNFEILYLP